MIYTSLHQKSLLFFSWWASHRTSYSEKKGVSFLTGFLILLLSFHPPPPPQQQQQQQQQLPFLPLKLDLFSSPSPFSWQFPTCVARSVSPAIWSSISPPSLFPLSQADLLALFWSGPTEWFQKICSAFLNLDKHFNGHRMDFSVSFQYRLQHSFLSSDPPFPSPKNPDIFHHPVLFASVSFPDPDFQDAIFPLFLLFSSSSSFLVSLQPDRRETIFGPSGPPS